MECASRLVTALQEFSFRRIRYEITNWAETTAQMDGVGRDPLAPDVVAVSAYGHWVRGDLDGAVDLANQSSEMHRALHSGPNALAERVLGNALFCDGRTEHALAAMENMVAGAHTSGCASRIAHAFYMSSVAQMTIGNPTRGADLAERAGMAAEEFGSPTAAAQAAFARGVALRPVDVDEASRVLQHAADLGELAGNRWIRAFALTEVHSLSARHGDLVGALRGLADVIDGWRRGGDWVNQWLSLGYVFRLLVRLGSHHSAAVLHGALVEVGAASAALPSQSTDADDLTAQVDLLREMRLSERIRGSCPAGEVRAVAASVEEAEGDELVGGAEPEGHAGEEPELGVHTLGQPVGQAVRDAGDDPAAVLLDAVVELDERGNLTAPSPLEPGVEHPDGFVTAVLGGQEPGCESSAHDWSAELHESRLW